MLEVTCNDRLGKKVRVKCNPDDTVGDLKKLIAAQTGTRYDKIVLKKWYTVFKDHIKLSDCILFQQLFMFTISKIICILRGNTYALLLYFSFMNNPLGKKTIKKNLHLKNKC